MSLSPASFTARASRPRRRRTRCAWIAGKSRSLAAFRLAARSGAQSSGPRQLAGVPRSLVLPHRCGAGGRRPRDDRTGREGTMTPRYSFRVAQEPSEPIAVVAATLSVLVVRSCAGSSYSESFAVASRRCRARERIVRSRGSATRRPVVVRAAVSRVIAHPRTKTDRLDARVLARLLWTGEPEAVWMPDERCRVLRRRLARREQLVRKRSCSVASRARSSSTSSGGPAVTSSPTRLNRQCGDRYGGFVGQPYIRGTVAWTLADRSVVIAGERRDEAFEEVVS